MRPPRRVLAATALPLALTLALTACGGDGDGDTAEDPATGGDAALTPRALAWVTAEHLGAPDSARASDDLEELGKGTVGTDLRYGSTGEDDGDAVTVGVTRELPPGLLDCDSPDTEYLAGCEEIADGVLLQWEAEAPEEDPGVVYVLAQKDGAGVIVFQSSTPITGDPRELDLDISVEEMVELAQDDRVAPTTSQEAVDEGERIAWWNGNGPDD